MRPKVRCQLSLKRRGFFIYLFLFLSIERSKRPRRGGADVNRDDDGGKAAIGRSGDAASWVISQFIALRTKNAHRRAAYTVIRGKAETPRIGFCWCCGRSKGYYLDGIKGYYLAAMRRREMGATARCF